MRNHHGNHFSTVLATVTKKSNNARNILKTNYCYFTVVAITVYIGIKHNILMYYTVTNIF